MKTSTKKVKSGKGKSAKGSKFHRANGQIKSKKELAKDAATTTSLPALKEAFNASKVRKAKEVVGVRPDDYVLVSEAVGCHFSADAKVAPKADDVVHLKVGHQTVALKVKYTKPKVDGTTLVMAFVYQKGDYKILAEHKGEKAQVCW